MRALLVLLLTAGPAIADELPRIDVEVGSTVRVDVGPLRGLRCDNVDIIKVKLENRDEGHNDFVVTGVSEGSTQCRVGTEIGQAWQVYNVRVIAHKPHPPRS